MMITTLNRMLVERCSRSAPRQLITIISTPGIRKLSGLGKDSADSIRSSDSDYFGSGGPAPTFDSAKEEEEFQIRLKILGASLNHVNTKGWSQDALQAGASDLSLSSSIASLCTPYDLVEYFQRSSNHKLEEHLKATEKKDKSLFSSIEYRINLVTPFIDRYHQAMGLSLEPTNVPRSLAVLRELSDAICINGLGDTSTDLRWYTKRTGIISLYVATECCLVQDKSDNFEDTRKFLKRRVEDYEACESATSSILPIMESGVTTFLNILGLNRRR